ncbi:tRNA dihydrouridine synthase DusB [Methylomarinum vadi]|uniref:tRNA dihydrouridine synthase DusB n=1 Tax=Methylomarinum vadi TaxID=438855 RepID=UPI0004DF57EC|nr:tRNA dihydrouridine synthase DusB [Methylomarinum vadi]
MQIGPYHLANNLILAPMAGVSDRPFRDLCLQFGAGLTVSEMVTSIPHLQDHHKTLRKIDHKGGNGLRSVQILGTDPEQMAAAARLNVDRGAQIIDINMGCPAKKVCSVAAGSALMKNEGLVERILSVVVNAVDVPVTLKIRTGWNKQHRNALSVAKIAENCGIQALTIHGRTRACRFTGKAEYDTIRQVKQAVSIPVIANGDINSAAKAKEVLAHTGADGVMIGRAAQGRPWIFREILNSRNVSDNDGRPSLAEAQSILNNHLENLYCFYGKISGVKIARKHIGWYFDNLGAIPPARKQEINQAQLPSEQLALVNLSFTDITHNAA